MSRKVTQNIFSNGLSLDSASLENTIIVFMGGQLLALSKSDDDDFVQVGIPDFGDDHYLTVTIYKPNPLNNKEICTLKSRGGALPSDLWLDVEKPMGHRFSYQMVVDDPSDLDDKNPTHDLDIQWLANFEASNYHNKALSYDRIFMQRSILLTAGHFFNASKFSAKRIKGAQPENQKRSSSAIFGAIINFAPKSSASFVFDDDPDHSFFEFLSDGPYIVVISNNPPIGVGERKSDFQKYYRIVKGIPPSERFDFPATDIVSIAPCAPIEAKKEDEAVEVLSKIFEWFPEVIRILKTEDVPCLPGGGGFP
jgi:hypothetical protein